MENITSVRLPASVVEEAMAMTGRHSPRAAITALVKARKPAYRMDDGLPSKKMLKRIAALVPQEDFKPTRSLFAGE